MPIAEAASVVTALRNASDLVERIRNSDNREELRAGAASLVDLLFAARKAALDLIEQKALLMDERSLLNERVKALESENRRLVDFGDQSEKYERIQTQGGQFVYREKAPADRNATAPYFCPKCFLDAKPSILQGRIFDAWHMCPTCKWSADL